MSTPSRPLVLVLVLACTAAVDGQTAPDHGRKTSGIVTLYRHDDVRSNFGFTTSKFGLVVRNGKVLNQNSQVMLVPGESGNDALWFGAQGDESACAVDLGNELDNYAKSVFPRIGLADAIAALAREDAKSRSSVRIPVKLGHVYVVRIDNVGEPGPYLVRGDSVHVKLRVIDCAAGRYVTLRWALVLAPEFPEAQARWSIRGKVVFAGGYQKPRRFPFATTDVVAKAALPGDWITVEKDMINRDGSLPHVFVFVRSVNGVVLEHAWRFAVPEPATLKYEKCRYVPHVLGLVRGQKLRVTSVDDTMHNLHYLGKRNPSINVVLRKGDVRDAVFKKPEVAMFKCDVHGWESCVVHVHPHPIFTVTDEHGRFSLPKLPDGKYEIVAVHEKHGRVAKTIVVAGKPRKPLTLELGR